jgi:DNA-3-methyladenine glycosylase
MKLEKDFYTRNNVVLIAKELLGKEIFCKKNNKLYSGIICETEAYAGITDKASHVYNNRRTKRTETMFMEGGVAYVYLCYGIHHLFNIVTNKVDCPDAVLIRGIIPFKGFETIPDKHKKGIGPGRVSSLLGITTKDDKLDLGGNTIWIEHTDIIVTEDLIKTSKRIGIDYAEEDALLPYRFQFNYDVDLQ